MPSVLASLPKLRAKSRAHRGLMTATGSFAAANTATTSRSRPPVASSTISSTLLSSRLSRCTSSSRPFSSRPTWKLLVCGPLRATSRTSFETSIPTNTVDPFLRTDFLPWPILAEDTSFARAPVRAWAESASVRRPWLGDGLLDPGAFELAHGENFSRRGAFFNIQGAGDAKIGAFDLLAFCGALAVN